MSQRRSYVWGNINRLPLSKNMRVDTAATGSVEERKRWAARFDAIGEGNAETFPDGSIRFPAANEAQEGNELRAPIDAVFP